MTQIKNEYSLVIAALMNTFKERNFLQTKIQQLLCNAATPTQLRDTLIQMSKLRHRLETVQQENYKSHKAMDDADLLFVKHIYLQYDLELERLKKNSKAHRDLSILGKWQFLKDWLEDRKSGNEVILKLCNSLAQKRDVYRALIPEEDEIKILDSDSTDVRKMKLHIESLCKAHKLHQADVEMMGRREVTLQAQINAIDTKIKNVSGLLSKDPRKTLGLGLPSQLTRRNSFKNSSFRGLDNLQLHH